MRATQVEDICQHAVLSQPDIDSLISLPISKPRSKVSELKDYSDDTKKERSDVDQDDLPIGTGGGSFGTHSKDSRQIPKPLAKLQMPDIWTPSSQDLIPAHDSE